jgi:hypothetical protein
MHPSKLAPVSLSSLGTSSQTWAAGTPGGLVLYDKGLRLPDRSCLKQSRDRFNGHGLRFATCRQATDRAIRWRPANAPLIAAALSCHPG